MLTRIFTAIFLLAFANAFAQLENPRVPQVLPSSPEVTSFIKGADLSTTPHTGAANASIPVYEIKLKKLNLPISINYNSNGFKPGEIPSRVGYGWSLNAGGAISRVIHGKPDDHCDFPTPPGFGYTMEAYNYFQYAGNDSPEGWDSQPDEYRYSVNGLSGRFFIKRDNSILQMPYNNVRITVTTSGSDHNVTGVTILDNKGITYIFNKIEETQTHSMEGQYGSSNIKTAWLLSSMTAPDGETITFEYEEIQTHFISGYSESYVKGIELLNCDGNFICGPDGQFDSKYSIVKYNAWKLINIHASDGTWINFQYENRPYETATNEVRLTNIQVTNTQTSPIIKTVLLHYYEDAPQEESGLEGHRFFLESVTVQDPIVNQEPEQQKYKLEYYHGQSYTSRFSYSVDHLGYANGAPNTNILPNNTFDAEFFGGTPSANREPHGEAAMQSMLSRITYPTGGVDEFTYEPNREEHWGPIPVKQEQGLHLEKIGAGATSGPNGPIWATDINYVTIEEGQTAQLFVETHWSGTGLYSNAQNSICTVRDVTIVDNDFQNAITSVLNEGYCLHQVGVPLQGGHTYKIVLESHNPGVLATANLVYYKPLTPIWGIVGNELCGVRVKQIESYDPVSNKSTNKYYRYWSLTDTTHASAQQLYFPEYISLVCKLVQCGGGTIPNTAFCYSKVLSSNSALTLYVNDDPGVAYKWVIESDDLDYHNGGVEHTFKTAGRLLGITVTGFEVLQKPSDPYIYMNGVETFTRYFNSNRQIVKTVENSFPTTPIILDQETYYNIHKRGDQQSIGNPITGNDFANLDIERYTIQSLWHHLDYTETKDIDPTTNNTLTTRVSYTYGDKYAQPTTITTRSSDGIELSTANKYPPDITGASSGPVLEAMKARNIITPVIESKTYKAHKILSTTVTDYAFWDIEQKIIEPIKINAGKGTNDMEARIRFNSYNNKSNLLEVSKESGALMAYVWRYKSSLPVAEFKNAPLTKVAYTSFEDFDGDKAEGGWTYTGTPQQESFQPTGRFCYSLSNGSLTRTIADADYHLTLWVKDGSGSLSISRANTQQVLLQANGWTCYHYTSQGGYIVVEGSAIIDEVRLYPVGSFPTTYTYTPGVGVTTVTDANNRTTYFEYDGFGRLLLNRDFNRNIIKQYEYKMGQPIVPCETDHPAWMPTGHFRCQKNNPLNNNNTGYKEREDRDLNNCSGSYLSTRWVQLSNTTSDCPIISNCSGVNRRVINGVCVAGLKVYTRSKYVEVSGQWECTYHYSWPDGYQGEDQNPEYHSSPCLLGGFIEY